jgi:lysozyme family protein
MTTNPKIEEMLKTIIAHEGGYCNVPGDKGGATNFGVTLAVLRECRNDPSLDADDVKNMTLAEAKEIYAEKYYHDPKIDMAPLELQPQLLDIAVNSGPGKAIKILQQVLVDLGKKVAVDGGMGPATAKAAQEACNEHTWKVVNNKIAESRLAFYNRIVERDPVQAKFLKGWTTRANSFKV